MVDPGGSLYINSPTKWVAPIRNELISPEENAANAQLMAAAPDLYEACQKLATIAAESVDLGDYPELRRAVQLADDVMSGAPLAA
jgi:hypothetical protein